MSKKWKKKIDSLLSFAIIVILLPLSVTIIGQHMQLKELIYGESGVAAEIGQGSGESSPEVQIVENGEAGESEQSEETAGHITDTEENGLTAQPDVETRLIGTVAKEIGVDAEEEAILAQCVIARTNIYDARMRGTSEPEALDIAEMQALWGRDFEKLYGRIEECVTLTNNEVLLWDGSYIYAAYHALSAGRTRDMTEIYQEAKMPYLSEILCQEDTAAIGYLGVFYKEKEEFLEECRQLFPENNVETLSDLEVQSRDAAGYVKEIRVGSAVVSGEKFRKQFGWNSSCFSISEVDGQIRIVTKGLGHGFGLSQNTARCMAAEGKDYKEILALFYPGAELFRLSAGE